MTNPATVYEIKSCDIKERQLFVRSYYVQHELCTGTYFIDGGKVFYISADDGEIGKCNFNPGFLNTGYTVSIQPLDEYYRDAFSKESEVEANV